MDGDLYSWFFLELESSFFSWSTLRESVFHWGRWIFIFLNETWEDFFDVVSLVDDVGVGVGGGGTKGPEKFEMQ